MNRLEKIRGPRPLQISSKHLLLLLFGVIVHQWMSPLVSSRDEPPPRQGGSKLGGYETPPPANHVPEHLFEYAGKRPAGCSRLPSGVRRYLHGRQIRSARTFVWSISRSAILLRKVVPFSSLVLRTGKSRWGRGGPGIESLANINAQAVFPQPLSERVLLWKQRARTLGWLSRELLFLAVGKQPIHRARSFSAYHKTAAKQG